MQQYTHENVRSIPHLPIYCDRYEDYRQFSPRHWHDHIEIIYVVSGSLQVVCGENEYTLQENEFFVINSNKNMARKAMKESGCFWCRYRMHIWTAT